jgi:hypothetical protein
MTIESFDASASSSVGDFSAFPAMLYSGDPFYSGGPGLPTGEAARFFLAESNGKTIGRAATVVNPLVLYKGEKTGMIGWYECENDTPAAAGLLDVATAHLRRNGCVWAVGPINGSTWHAYRATLASRFPPFFLDNYHKPWYCSQFQSNGFVEAAHFYSTKVRLTARADERIRRFETTLAGRGLRVRPLSMARFENEIETIYRVCAVSFKENFLYSPIAVDEFREMYLRLRPFVDPDLVLLAEDRTAAPVGFVFAVPDIFEKPVKTAVIKTVAIIPRKDIRGLGTYLVAKIHEKALSGGYTSVIHALMHESNISTRILSDNSEPYHEYALFCKKIL